MSLAPALACAEWKHLGAGGREAGHGAPWRYLEGGTTFLLSSEGYVPTVLLSKNQVQLEPCQPDIRSFRCLALTVKLEGVLHFGGEGDAPDALLCFWR